jgi:hypothetical protein
LLEDHFNVCLRLFRTKSYYSIKDFPFAWAFSAWLEECDRRNVAGVVPLV